LRVRALSATLLSLTIFLATASSAFAGATGGTASRVPLPISSPTTGGSNTSSPATKKPKVHTAPVTGHSVSLVYHGPVYEKTATGQIVPYVPPPPAGQLAHSGGSPVGMTASAKPELLVPGATARMVDGLAAAPMSAPAAIQQIVWAGNQIIGLPYIFGGGHASFTAEGYDCSGTVSFALHGARLISTPMDSSEFMGWGGGGVGQWVTIFSNSGHAYMTVAGLRLDTSAADDPTNQQGPRWRPLRPGNGGFKVRHPVGL
jgi:cell wall-associated NlpC family hydrolase